MGRFVRKPTTAEAGGVPTAFADHQMAKVCPALLEYLVEDRWEDGSARERATLLLFVEDGWWKACLNDRASQRALWASASTLQGVLGTLEECLQQGTGEWRKNAYARQGGGGGRKKS